MNDAGFFNPRPTGQWIDIPATYHNGACGFAMADGHSEIHKWRTTLASARAKAVKFTDGGDMSALLGGNANDVDIRWMVFHGGTVKPVNP